MAANSQMVAAGRENVHRHWVFVDLRPHVVDDERAGHARRLVVADHFRIQQIPGQFGSDYAFVSVEILQLLVMILHHRHAYDDLPQGDAEDRFKIQQQILSPLRFPLQMCQIIDF